VTLEKPSMDTSSLTARLVEIAESVRLREGAEGIAKALWALAGGSARSTHEWSRILSIPVPVLAALRRELEKRDILQPGSGLHLTEAGKRFLDSLFGLKESPDALCPTCRGKGRILPPQALPLLDEFAAICASRPTVDVTKDQSHATPETGIRKALLLLEKGLLGKSILFLGDDDFISVACLLARKRFLSDSAGGGKLTVLDIDRRYLDRITEISQGEIVVREYDVRNEFSFPEPEPFLVALTDPPYTVNAITTFAYRCRQAMQAGGTLFLSMPLPDTETLGEIERNLIGMGWSLREIYPQWNEYIGASIHAHHSSLFVCEKLLREPPENSFQLRYTPFYTADLRKPGAAYQCTLCETVVAVGPGQEFETIQELKQAGCAECGNTHFRRQGKTDAD